MRTTAKLERPMQSIVWQDGRAAPSRPARPAEGTMPLPGRRNLVAGWRKALFVTWIVAASAAALVAAVLGPIVSADGADGTTLVALVSPLCMLVFLVAALLWLALLVLSARNPNPALYRYL
jgi:hypothetical protein